MPDVLPLDLDGKVVVIRGETDPDDEDRLAAELFANGAALVVRLTPGETVETLDAEEMRAAGWVRGELRHEWRVTGDPGKDYPRYEFTYRSDDDRWPGDAAELTARGFVERQDWARLHHRTVTTSTTDWTDG